MGQLIIGILISLLLLNLILVRIQSQKVDLTFVIDTKDDINKEQFHQVVDFVYNITERINIGPNATQVAVVTFNTGADTQINFNDHNDSSSLLNDISELKSLTLSDGSRKTGNALNHIREHIYSNNEGKRDNANKVVIVFIFGEGELIAATEFSAVFLQIDVNTMYAIGIGDFVLDSNKKRELSLIATDPDDDHILSLTEFSNLCNYVSNVTMWLDPSLDAFTIDSCPAITTTTTTTTIATTTVEELESSSITTSSEVITKEETTTLTYTTTIDLTTEMITTFQEISNTTIINSTQTETEDLLVFIIVPLVLFLVIIAIIIFGVHFYIPRKRIRKRREELILLVVSFYPDNEHGLGPARLRYKEAPQPYINGYSSKFHAYLKLSMLNNGFRVVSR